MSFHAHVLRCARGVPRGRDIVSPGIRLTEDYVVRVLGFDRRALVESRGSLSLNRSVLNEHLIFEGFWSDAKEKVLDAIKDNPITSAADAVKRFGDGLDGVVVTLSSVVSSGGDAIDAVRQGASQFASKRIKGIVKDLRALMGRLEELSSKLSAGARVGLEKIVGKLKAFSGEFASRVVGLVSGGSGWKGMMGALVVYLALSAVSPKISILVDSSLKLLSGEPEKMVSGATNLRDQAVNALELKGEVNDAADVVTGNIKGDDDDLKILTASGMIWSAVQSMSWGFVKRAVREAGEEALTQLSGPVGWIKKLASTFKMIAGGMAWVCERISAAARRATFGPRASS